MNFLTSLPLHKCTYEIHNERVNGNFPFSRFAARIIEMMKKERVEYFFYKKKINSSVKLYGN